MNKTMRTCVLGCLMGLAWCGGAMAERVWICAVVDGVACNDAGEVGEPDLGTLSRPTFLRVDADKKMVTILAPASRRGETSKVETLATLDNGWLLTGTEAGKGWTLIINEKEGHMTLSVTGDGEVWSVFGHAIPETALSVPE